MREAEIKAITRQCMIRAAEVIDKITNDDVLAHQGALLAGGMPLEKLAKVDRAMLAACHLRAMAEELKP